MKHISRRSFLSATAALSAMGALSACGAASSSTAASSSVASSAAASSEAASSTAGALKFKVGVSQLVQHVALDAATEGFCDKLNEMAAEAGATVEIDIQNASGDSVACSSIASQFVASGVDLIMANATGALQAAVAATGDIPIVGTAVTEYGVALDISDFSGTVGTNVTGCSDLAPLDKQAEMLTTIFPEAKKVGLLYCSAEPNSQYQVDAVQALLEAAGLTCTQYSFADTNDVTSVTQSACADSDVIYVPTDNTVASNTEAINNVCLPSGVPIIAGEEGICSGCGVATLSISYYDLGVATGAMAGKILFEGADVTTMAIEYAATSTPKYNEALCAEYGITPPSDYVKIEIA